MSAAALKCELASIRGALASLTPAASEVPGDPIAWAERTAGLMLDPWQRDVLLSGAPRLLLNATRQSGKSTAAALKAARTVLQGRARRGGQLVFEAVRLSLSQAHTPPRRLRRRLSARDHDRDRACRGRACSVLTR